MLLGLGIGQLTNGGTLQSAMLQKINTDVPAFCAVAEECAKLDAQTKILKQQYTKLEAVKDQVDEWPHKVETFYTKLYKHRNNTKGKLSGIDEIGIALQKTKHASDTYVSAMTRSRHNADRLRRTSKATNAVRPHSSEHCSTPSDISDDTMSSAFWLSYWLNNVSHNDADFVVAPGLFSGAGGGFDGGGASGDWESLGLSDTGLRSSTDGLSIELPSFDMPGLDTTAMFSALDSVSDNVPSGVADSWSPSSDNYSSPSSDSGSASCDSSPSCD